MISKIQKFTLADEAYERIKADILSKNLKEGAPIPSENQLSRSLSVSRVVVREALQRLREERLIVTYHGKGSFVANRQNFERGNTEYFSELDYTTFKDIMELRASIECSAIVSAVENADEAELERVKAHAKIMEAVRDDDDAFDRADYDFHLAILCCSHNQMYVKIAEQCNAQIMLCLKAMNRIHGSREYALELHTKIADCLYARNAKEAIYLLKNNGEYNLARMREFFP
ncbi:MAG: FadR family transcriptional regulator [Clostridia bacterium]|nr:FadR family transcriptional regulator [Clostridia bacterium]